MNKCDKCGFLHYRTDPCRKPKKSTERKNKPVRNGDALAVSLGLEDRASSAKQAVDTKPRRGRPKMEAPTSARADYQRIYVALWRKGLVGKKHVKSQNASE